ncbi:MAG: hypothetical protein WD648_05635 [Planctomycetaceae bacterium]
MAEKTSTWNRVALIAAMSKRAPKGSLNRTAIMKCAYLLQTIRNVPLGYHFTLYSYGPYDSDVLGDLDYAELLEAVTVKRVDHTGGYGYDIRAGAASDRIQQKATIFLQKYAEEIAWVLQEFGARSSAELELASTLVYADRETPVASQTISELVRKVRDVKPHFAEERILVEAKALQEKKLLKSVR